MVAEVQRFEVAGEADVSVARRAARRAMEGRSDDAVHAAELVISELVTNGLLHGGGLVTVTVIPLPKGVRIEVGDRNRHAPLVALESDDAMTGRGLALVRQVSEDWGVEPTAMGKVVWAQVVDGPHVMAVPASADVAAAWADLLADLDAPRVHISLGEVPTSLLVAAKRHVDNLVREFTLAAGGDRTGTTQPLPAPLAELIDRVVHNFEDARLELKRQATEAARAGARHTFVELDLTLDAADAAEEYLDALDEVDAYCRANRMLTLETPPQHRVFRRWYIGELIDQVRAAQRSTPAPPVVPFEERLLREVDDAESARRSADRAARLYSAAVALASAVTAEEVADAVLREGVAALGASGGGVLLAADADRIAVPGTLGYDESTVESLRQESREDELPAAYALRTGESVWLETIEERNARFPGLAGLEPNTVAMCAVPVTVGEDVIGALRFSFTERELFDDDERFFVEALAAETGEALQRADLLRSEREARVNLEHERESLEKLAAVGEAMLRGRDLASVIQLASDAATQITGAEFGAFFYGAAEASAAFPLRARPDLFAPTFDGAGTVRLDDLTADPRFAGGDSSVRSYLAVPVTLGSGEVAGGLFFSHREPGRFDEVAERLATGVAGQTSAAIDNVRSLEERTRVAAVLQQSLLPAALPAIEGLDLGASYAAAATTVGGDFYDIFPLGPHRWGVAMGDVRGRGPEAASLTAQTRYTIRTAALLCASPAEVLGVLNDAFHTTDDDERFCSALFGIVDLDPDGAGPSFTFANAGHPPLAVLRAGGGPVVLAPPTGGLVGLFPGATFGEEVLVLGPGDSLVLYTDGVSEARRGGEEFGDRAFVELLGELAGGSAADIAGRLTAAAKAFGEASATDDAAVFVLRILATG